ncbi:ubiquinone biosynthesis protein [Comamonadaceae bacterium OH2545_COT-014]|nr:ubiquinone biosynthesis protein [Comamonadaceae bacterium OH2545_COT-014]
MPAASFLSAVSAFPTAIYTVLLGVALVYWVLALLGMVDFESSSIDLDISAHADASPDSLGQIASYVLAFGLGGVPFSIALSLLALTGWTLSCLAGMWLLPLLPAGPMHWLAALAALLASAALAVVITARLVRPLRRLFVTHNAPSHAALVGQVCRILTGVVDERQGRAEVAQRGASLNIRVWAPRPNTLARGQQALIVEYDAASQRFLVQPLDAP